MTISIHKQIFFLFTFLTAFLQCSLSQVESTDTTNVASPDSLPIHYIKPIPFVGTIDRNLSSENVITDSMVNFDNYRYTGDFALLRPGVFIKDFGSLGLLPDFTIEGLGGINITFMSDGVILNDPLTGLFNPYLYPTENIERMEIIVGTRAFLYGLNSTGGAINFISKSKKAIHPYSRLRYSESGYGFGIIDGMVSEDIIRGLNLTMGIQHTVYGERYQNENYDCWNGRIKARYNINDKVNIFASEMYNQSLLGMYGGVDITTTPYSIRFISRQANVRNTEAYEKLARHDAQAGVAGRFLPDSEAISTMTFYYTSNVRGYLDPENTPFSNGIFVDQYQQVRWFGLKLTQNVLIGNQKLDVGADVRTERVHLSPATKESSATHLSLSGKYEMPITQLLTISSYGRFDNYRGQHLLSYGGDGIISPTSCLKIFGGYSRSFRLPTFIERMGVDTILSSSLTDNLPERHHLFEVGFRWENKDQFSMEGRSFHRTIWNVITVRQQSQANSKSPYEFTRHQKKILQGFTGTASLRIGSFYLEGEAQFLESIDHDEKERTFPKWSATGSIYYWDKIIHDHLDLKIGVHGNVYTSYYGQEFNQQAEEYLPNDQGSAIENTGVIDFVIVAHIGKAYIHFIMDNLFNRQYIMTSFYPMPERQMRFGVSWDFLD